MPPICSICNKNTANFKNIFERDKDSVTWCEKLAFCVPEVEWTNNYIICSICLEQLEVVYWFRNQCLRSCLLKRNAVSDSNTSVKNEEIIEEHDTVDASETSEGLPSENYVSDDNKQDIYTCFHCSQVFVSKADITAHIQKQHGLVVDSVRKFGCPKCSEVFNSKNVLDDHLVNHNTSEKDVIRSNNDCDDAEELHKCEVCGGIFNTKYLLKRHKQNVHATEKKYKCEMCGQMFASQVYLSAHKRYHTGHRSYICSSCGKGYITASDLYHHEKIHANKREYRCEECPKAFNTSSDLHKHKICVHWDRAHWKYVCKFCDKRFPLKTNLDTHTKTHTGEKNFACHLCDRKCISKSALNRHIESHSNVRCYQCDVCNQEYKYQKSLAVHLAKAHSVGNVKIPDRTKRFSCHMCFKSYSANNKLQKHIRGHMGEKPFLCRLCPKKFANKSSLKHHLKTVHGVTAEYDNFSALKAEIQ